MTIYYPCCTNSCLALTKYGIKEAFQHKRRTKYKFPPSQHTHTNNNPVSQYQSKKWNIFSLKGEKWFGIGQMEDDLEFDAIRKRKWINYIFPKSSIFELLRKIRIFIIILYVTAQSICRKKNVLNWLIKSIDVSFGQTDVITHKSNLLKHHTILYKKFCLKKTK